jgi:hypothetical protein
MTSLAKNGKVWTRKIVQVITNDFGNNAWAVRGGITGHKDGVTEAYCNHVWMAITKTRKKNG